MEFSYCVSCLSCAQCLSWDRLFKYEFVPSVSAVPTVPIWQHAWHLGTRPPALAG